MGAARKRAKRAGVHRWVRAGFGLWRCQRRGCGLRRKDARGDNSRDGWLYLAATKGARWRPVQDLRGGKVPACKGGRSREV